MRSLVVVAVAACGSPPPRAPVVTARPEARQTSDATLCTVLRSYAPASRWWVFHGCPPLPEPVPAGARPCAVDWGPDATSIRYDASGHAVRFANRAVATDYTYDGSGALIRIEWTIGDRRGAYTVTRDANGVSYDKLRFEVADGRITTLHDDQGEVRFVRDSAKRLVEVWSELWSKPLAFEYDHSGALVRRTDERETWTFRYDASGRLIGIDGWDAPVTVHYQCDGAP